MRSCKFSLDYIDDFQSNLESMRNAIYEHSRDISNFADAISNRLEQVVRRYENRISDLRFKLSQLQNELSNAYSERQALINQGQSKGNGEEGVAYRQMLAPRIDGLTIRIHSLEETINEVKREIDELERNITLIQDVNRWVSSTIRDLKSNYNRKIREINTLEEHVKTACKAAERFCEIGVGSYSQYDVHEIRDIDAFPFQATSFDDIKNELTKHRSDSKEGLHDYQSNLSDNISYQIGEQLEDIYGEYGKFLRDLDKFKDQMEEFYESLDSYYRSSDYLNK